MDKVKVTIAGISCSITQPEIFAIMLLDEEEGRYRVPVIVGEAEARAIIAQLEGGVKKRISPQELLKNFLDRIEATIIEVYIHRWEAGIFLAKIQVTLVDGRMVSFDTRASDAISVALLAAVPVYIARDVFEKTALVVEGNELVPRNAARRKDRLDTLSTEQLARLMEEAVKKEDYEKASLYRDALKNRKHDQHETTEF
ncbi:MAG: bifunctional nuclease family protein [Odoribacteraceae bacterium]|jgi:bifunctional DNase/RNase|nr:bifunctional nuclease family protein [Odoribacteraceae bacterium]